MRAFLGAAALFPWLLCKLHEAGAAGYLWDLELTGAPLGTKPGS